MHLPTTPVAAVLLCLGAPATSGAPLLFGNPEFLTGRASRDVTMADLDGDGDLDLVTADQNDNTVSVLLNLGSGDYAPAVAYAVDDQPNAVAAGDLDGTNGSDLAVACRAGDSVTILLNDGSATFTNGPSSFAGDDPYALDMGDLDGDGDLDLAVVNRTGNGITLLLGNGDGTLAFDSFIGFTNSPTAVALADLDGDGLVDLASVAADDSVPASNPGKLMILYNGGSAEGPAWAGFTSSEFHSTGARPEHVAIAQIDGQPGLDIAVADGGPLPAPPESTVSIFLNTGSGAFVASGTPAVERYPSGVGVADLDGDGDGDIAVSHFDAATFEERNISVLMNTGNGTFDPYVSYGVSDMASMVALGDVDGDGDADLAASIFVDPVVSVLINAGDGTFGGDVRYAAGDNPQEMATGDVNGDGFMDIVTTGGADNNIVILLNDGSAGMAAPAFYPAGSWPVSVGLADLDGDGDLDAAATNFFGPDVSVLLNQGSGTFGAAVGYDIGGAGTSALQIALADLDGDDDVDIVSAMSLDHWPWGGIGTLLNDGTGAFSAGPAFDGAGQNAIAAADLDGDDDIDVAVVSYDGVWVFANNGDATFAPEVNYPAGPSPQSLAAGDLDGDGDIDLLTNDSSGDGAAGDNLIVLANNGNGTFAPYTAWPAGHRPLRASLGDLDGDGDLDIASAILYTFQVNIFKASVVLNEGDGTFGSPVLYDVGVSPVYTAVADLDSDGDGDLAVSNSSSDDISVLVNLAETAAPCPWDCDGSGDGNVNVSDLLALLGQYDASAPAVCDGGESCDHDGNGCVDVTDLLKLLSHFTTDPSGIGCPQ